jgi:hypothetical protein
MLFKALVAVSLVMVPVYGHAKPTRWRPPCTVEMAQNGITTIMHCKIGKTHRAIATLIMPSI